MLIQLKYCLPSHVLRAAVNFHLWPGVKPLSLSACGCFLMQGFIHSPTEYPEAPVTDSLRVTSSVQPFPRTLRFNVFLIKRYKVALNLGGMSYLCRRWITSVSFNHAGFSSVLRTLCTVQTRLWISTLMLLLAASYTDNCKVGVESLVRGKICQNVFFHKLMFVQAASRSPRLLQPTPAFTSSGWP